MKVVCESLIYMYTSIYVVGYSRKTETVFKASKLRSDNAAVTR